MRTHIFKYNVLNLISLVTRHLDFKTLHHNFEHASNKVMCYVLDNVEDIKKISIFQYKNIFTIVVLLERYISAVFLRTLFTLVSF